MIEELSFSYLGSDELITYSRLASDPLTAADRLPRHFVQDLSSEGRIQPCAFTVKSEY